MGKVPEMANEDRPYRGYGESELLELRRNLIKESREVDRSIARNRGDPDYTRPDSGPRSRLNIISRDLQAITREFDIRHGERAARETRKMQPRVSNVDGLVWLACACHPPRRIRLKQNVY